MTDSKTRDYRAKQIAEEAARRLDAMTDNQTTELRKLLNEHGVEYVESQDRFRTRFRFNYCEACGDYLNEIEVMGACITASKSYLTPEQAVAATLGAHSTTHSTTDSSVREYESRWHNLFGTPEKVADMLPRTLVACRDCVLQGECLKEPDDGDCLVIDREALVAWLREKVVKQ